MLDIKNYFIQVMVKLGFKKKSERIGIKMENVSDVRMDGVTVSGYDKGMAFNNAQNIKARDVYVSENEKKRKGLNFLQKLFFGLGFIIITASFVEKLCDNSELDIWLQALVAIPCFPLFWFWGYVIGGIFIWSAFTEEQD